LYSEAIAHGSNWVIFKDFFVFSTAATILNKHLNGMFNDAKTEVEERLCI
jgi:hypothetical protein